MKDHISELEGKTEDATEKLKEKQWYLQDVQKEVYGMKGLFMQLNDVKVVLNRLAPYIEGDKDM
jgi:hypothetical protein